MALRPGSAEWGLRRSEMTRFTFGAGEMSLIPNHLEKWFRTDDLHYLSVGISDAALTEVADGTSGEVELRRTDHLVDARLRALVEAVNAEKGLRGFRVSGCFWILSSRLLPWRWSTVMQCGTVLCRPTEAG
jgi:hypothetical protein